jgi:hypothetical protein
MAIKTKRRLAADIRASLREAREYLAGKPTKVIVHRVTPSASAARRARILLGLPVRSKNAR